MIVWVLLRKRAISWFRSECSHSRGRALHVVPAFSQVLFEVTEGTQTQLPPDVRGVLLLGQEDLPQRVDFLLHLCNITPEGGGGGNSEGQ